MDLGIKELGITLIVGVFTLLGAEMIAYFLFNRPLTTFFQDVLRSNKTFVAGPDRRAPKDAPKEGAAPAQPAIQTAPSPEK